MSDIYDMTPDELRKRAQSLIYVADDLSNGYAANTYRASMAAALFALADHREKQAVPTVYDESEHYWTSRTEDVNGTVWISCKCGDQFFDREGVIAEEQHRRHCEAMRKEWEAKLDEGYAKLAADPEHQRHEAMRRHLREVTRDHTCDICSPALTVPRLLHDHRNRRWLDKTGDLWFFRDNYWLYKSGRTGKTSKCFSSIPECGPFTLMMETS